jgi:DNA polymerase type B, organellar and viral
MRSSIQIIKKPVKQRNFITYDMEWIPGSRPLRLRLIGMFDASKKRPYSWYTNMQSFMDDALTHRNRGKWFYAHAGGMADVQFVLAHIKERCMKNPGEYSFDAHFSGGSANIVTIRKGKQCWTFVDSFWLLRDRLSNIGKWIGHEKGLAVENEKDDPDEKGIDEEELERRIALKKEWYATIDIYTLRDYNERDCEILYYAISMFQDRLVEMGGQLQMTLASSAMQLFRRKYLSRDIDTFEEINEKVRKSYVASRVEVFNTDVDNGYYYDINSSFPFAMTQPCPGEYLGIAYSLPENDSRYIYFADCEVEVSDNYITPAPIRMKGRVFFPSGKWRGWFSQVDIELLQREGGKVVKVHEVLLFRPFHDLSNYATDLYTKRKNSTDEFEKIVFKLLLNSLYGKFAESPWKSSLVFNPTFNPITAEEQEQFSMSLIDPGTYMKEEKVSIPHVSVAISSHITALARKTLYDFLIENGKGFHYCDTDGFSTTEEYTTGKNLGDLKLEKILMSAHFMCAKMYMMKGQMLNSKNEWEYGELYKGKGFSRMTASKYMRLMEGKSINIERMRRIKENWKRHTWHPEEIKFEKQVRLKPLFAKNFDYLKDSLPKRMTYPDGETRPWNIDELRDMIGGENAE